MACTTIIAGLRRKSLLAALVLLSSFPVAAAQADRQMTTSKGIVVATPDIDGLDCAQMAKVLEGLDSSEYRGLDPLAEGDPDWPIYLYEQQITQAHYYQCTLGKSDMSDPSAAFSFGFQSN